MTAALPIRLFTAPAAAAARRSSGDFLALVLVCWILAVTCFTAPGRGARLDIGSLDWIGLTKTAARLLSVGVLSLVLLRQWRHSAVPHILPRLMPFALFALWTVASSWWSPLKAVSLGHALELCMSLMLAAAAGILAGDGGRLRILLGSLNLAVALVVLAVLTADWRTVVAGERPAGYMQPNALGAISGLGLVLLVSAHLLWRWRWASRFLMPGLLLFGMGLFVARSRTALAITLLVLAAVMWRLRRSIFWILCVLVIGVFAALLPYVELIANVPDSAAKYVLRGQQTEDLAGGSGRDELWQVALLSFRESPVFGHGYYSMTSTGSFRVWRSEQYQTAHNMTLHVLTGTGLLGGALFGWGAWAAFGPMIHAALGGRSLRKIEFLSLAVAAWALLQGIFEISILGPVGPSTVLFFATLGAAMAPAPGRGAA